VTLIISAIGRKGGITKTSTATNLAAACARAGLFTVFIETDGQGNASEIMGVEKSDAFYKLILKDAKWEEMLVPVPDKFMGMRDMRFVMLPASNLTSEVESHADTAQNMIRRIRQLRGVADVVILDTSPGLTNVHVGCYLVSDYVYLPTTTEQFSVSSLDSAFELLEQAKRIGGTAYPAAQVFGILPNRYNWKENDAREKLGEIKGGYKRKCRIFDPIENSVAWHDSCTRQLSIYALSEAPRNLPGLSFSRPAARKAMQQFDVFAQSVIELAKPVAEAVGT
jgi:chromosome partitioning protein